MFDYHIHTRYCRHAEGEVIDFTKAAIERGLKEIGFADHFPIIHLPKLEYNDYSMDISELPKYLSDIQDTQKQFIKKIRVKIASEIDYIKGKETQIKKNVSIKEFDYLIGVIHLVDNWIVDDPRYISKYNEYNLTELYRRYFQAVIDLIRSGLFDIVGHIDIIKKFNRIPQEGIAQFLMPCLDMIAKKDICIEVNTSGLDREVKDTFPGFNFYKILHDYNIKVTLGSDAHRPSEVGRHFERVLKKLKEAGYTKIASFSHRERTLKKLTQI